MNLVPPVNPHAVEYGENYLIVSEETRIEDFQDTWNALMAMHNAAPWWIGDLLNQGERIFGEQAAQVQDWTDLKYETLAKYKWVAKYFLREERKPELSFTHHLNAMKAPQEDRDFLLTKAVKDSLSTRDVLDLAKQLGLQRDSIAGESEEVIPDKPARVEYFHHWNHEKGLWEVWADFEEQSTLIATFAKGKEVWGGQVRGEFYAHQFIAGLKKLGLARE